MKDRIIHGIEENEIKGAVAQFNFRGFLISISQVFKPVSVAIFKGDFEKLDFNSVESALDFILQSDENQRVVDSGSNRRNE